MAPRSWLTGLPCQFMTEGNLCLHSALHASYSAKMHSVPLTSRKPLEKLAHSYITSKMKQSYSITPEIFHSVLIVPVSFLCEGRGFGYRMLLKLEFKSSHVPGRGPVFSTSDHVSPCPSTGDSLWHKGL